MPQFSAEKIFSQKSRENCIANLNRLRLPKYGKLPTAAVLIPLCVINETVSLLYTLRSVQLRNHSGQISFPGGKCDEGETSVETAVRETHEEIGIEKDQITIWGTGPAVPGRDNSILITPVVGNVDFRIENLKLNKDEVDKVFTVPLPALCDANNQFHTQFKNGLVLPVFIYEDCRIWGITAYITHTFLSCLLPRDLYNNKNGMKKKISLNSGTP